MPKEILIYGGIYEYSVAEAITQINEIEDGDPLNIRVNTGGGSPEYGFGLVAKFSEFPGDKNVKVDGKAFSMGAFFCVYATNVEALDVSEFMIHRAAYSQWFESNPEYFTEELRGNLERINKNLEKALRNKIDVAKFEEMKGVKIKDIFSMESRIDVFLSATEAKKIGLIDKINKITPQKRAELNGYVAEMAAKFEDKNIKIPSIPGTTEEEVIEAKVDEPKNDKKMTIEELQSKHPEAFKAAYDKGVKAENNRIGAWMVYADVDLKKVQAGVDAGEEMSSKDIAELNRASLNKEVVADAEEDSAKPVETPAAPKTTTEEEKSAEELKDFTKEVMSNFETPKV